VILFPQLQIQEEQVFGQKLAKGINGLSYVLVRGLYYINLLLFKEFRELKLLLTESFSFPLNKIQFPEQLINATVRVEDKRFYNHNGHDIISIFRAIINNFLGCRRIQGASTIEQQFVRTILKNNERTFKRKYFEITLSTLIFKQFTKAETINLYLTYYTFHDKIKGVHSICEKENYKIDQLTQKDIYEIVARFKYPIVTKGNYIKYLKRVRTIEIMNNVT